MIARVLLLGLVVLGLPAFGWSQSSQFGIRGLGLPGRHLSSRATGMGGSIGLLDPSSVLAKAPVTKLEGLTVGLETMQEWRETVNPSGTGSIRNNRFPVFRIGGPIVTLVLIADHLKNRDGFRPFVWLMCVLGHATTHR